MKKITGLALASVAVLALSGCTGSDGGSMDTYYLADVDGIGINSVDYNCNSNRGTTGTKGDFAFDTDGDSCKFFLDSDEAFTDQGLYIDKSKNNPSSGVDGIYYSCTNYDTSANPRTGDTVGHGHFNHTFNYDVCTFRF